MDARPAAVILAAGAECGLLIAVQVAFLRGAGSEATRRIAHAAGAASAALLPLLLRLSELVLLAAAFTALLAWTRARRRLGAVHGIQRVSVGAVVFPAGLLLAVLIGWHHPGAIAYGTLVLGLADPAAALAGERAPGVGWQVPGGHKTLAGSAAFAVVAAAIGLLMSWGAGEVRIPAALGAALVLAAVEAGLGYGLDNLPVPAAGSLIGVSVLGL